MNPRVALVVFALAALPGLVACSDLVGSCVSVNASDHTCIEVHGAVKAADLDAVKLDLCGLNNVWSTDYCITGNALGGCSYAVTSVTHALTLTAYHFPSGAVRTAADVKAICAAQKATFVTP